MSIAARCLGPRCRRFAVCSFVCLALASGVEAQPKAQLPATQPAPSSLLTLEDCIRIGLEKQPALDAQRSSLAAAEAQRVALEHLRVAALISKELPIRRQQACLGVTIADAGVQILEGDTIYAVSRTYYTALYARRQ